MWLSAAARWHRSANDPAAGPAPDGPAEPVDSAAPPPKRPGPEADAPLSSAGSAGPDEGEGGRLLPPPPALLLLSPGPGGAKPAKGRADAC